MSRLTPEIIWQALREIPDPEIPVVSIVELGVVRSIAVCGRTVVVAMTPTFSGCPAYHAMQSSVRSSLVGLGAQAVEVQTVLSPPWTTDWITPEARDKLKAFGLAPPPHHEGKLDEAWSMPAQCPYCDAHDTTLKNSFGSTPCRMIFYCNACRQPFEQFKPL